MNRPRPVSPGNEKTSRHDGEHACQRPDTEGLSPGLAAAAGAAVRRTISLDRRTWLAFLALAVLASVLTGSGLARATVSSQPYLIATSSKDNKYTPALSGEIVVWEDTRNANSDVYYRDLSASAPEAPVTIDPADQRNPVASGDVVVWQDNRNGNWDIYGYDLSTGGEVFPIATAAGDQRSPAISGDKVVWEDTRSGNVDIRGRDLSEGTAFAVVTGAGDQRSPAISGNRVVWSSQQTAANSDIYTKHLTTGEVRQVTTDPGWQADPDVSGDTLVWTDERNPGSLDVYSYDLSRNRESQVAGGTTDQYSPAVSDRIVVWVDGPNPDFGIYGKDLSTGRKFALSTSSNPKGSPDIDSETAVWEVQRDGETNYGVWGVYGADLDTAPAAPTNLGATGLAQGVKLEWGPGGERDLAGYNVYRSDSARGQYEKIASPAEPGYMDRSAPRGQQSYYRVTAVDTAGQESATARASAAAFLTSRLRLAATRATVNPGQATTLKGRLTFGPGGASHAGGKKVILRHRPEGQRFFTLLRGGRLTTAPDGTFRLAGVRPRKNTAYRATFAGKPGLKPSASNVVWVNVRGASATVSGGERTGEIRTSGGDSQSSKRVLTARKRNSSLAVRT